MIKQTHAKWWESIFLILEWDVRDKQEVEFRLPVGQWIRF